MFQFNYSIILISIEICWIMLKIKLQKNFKNNKNKF